jgi:hypothetical protein
LNCIIIIIIIIIIITEQIVLEVKLYDSFLEVLGSNLGLGTGYLAQVFRGLFRYVQINTRARGSVVG